MTKAIRIENADTSDHKVVIEVWHEGHEGEPHIFERRIDLSMPTQQITEYVYKGKYLIIREV